MDLSIKIIDSTPQVRGEVLSVIGQIEIGDELKESFYMPLDWWSVCDYQKQWKEGLDRLKVKNNSCLVATIYDPNSIRYINWWLLYKMGDKLYIRNQLLIVEIYEKRIGDKEFTVENCYDFIQPRRKKRRVSEWVIDYP